MKNLRMLIFSMMVLVSACKKDKQPSAPQITTDAVTSISASGANTGGNVSSDGGSAITRRGVAWALHNNPTVADSITSNGSGTGSFTVTLANLAANTAYHVRAFAINGVATAYGSDVSFTTAKGVPSVTTTAIGTIDAANAAGQTGGTIMSDGGAAVTARGVCWSTSPHPTTSSNLTVDGTGTGTFTSTITPLASTTTYYYRAYATNSYGTGYGNELSLTTSSTETVTDIDGNVYHTITIGTQTWMTENLRVTHYQNGDPITNGLKNFNWDVDQGGNPNSGSINSSSINWNIKTTGAYTSPNGDPSNDKQYGKNYNWFAVMDPRKLAPAGWHIPSDREWQQLEFYEGMAASDTGGTNSRGSINSKFIVGGSTGLNVQNAGLLFFDGTPADDAYYFFGDGGSGFLWTSTTLYSGTGSVILGNWSRAFNYANPDINGITREYEFFVKSVRCVKN